MQVGIADLRTCTRRSSCWPAMGAGDPAAVGVSRGAGRAAVQRAGPPQAGYGCWIDRPLPPDSVRGYNHELGRSPLALLGQSWSWRCGHGMAFRPAGGAAVLLIPEKSATHDRLLAQDYASRAFHPTWAV